MDTDRKNRTARAAIIGSFLLALLMLLSTLWMGAAPRRTPRALCAR